MKFVLALLGASNAVKLGDAPPFFNEPTWKQTWPSASGLVQLDEQIELSACEKNPTPGVICEDGSKFFANGMYGNEDIKQDIHMKMIPYHYAQNSDVNK